MKKTKRLGRGLEDISHYFISNNQAGTCEHSSPHESSFRNQYRSVSIVDISDPQRGAFLSAQIGMELSRNGIRVLLIDADPRFPGISFMLGLSLPGFSFEHYYQERYEPSDVVYTGPDGVKLLAPHLSMKDVNSQYQAEKSLMLDTLKSIEDEADIVIIRQFEDYITPIIDEALFVVPALTVSLISSFREMKKFMSADDRKKAGVLVSGAGKECTAIEIYEKICRCTEISYGIRPYFLGNISSGEVDESTLDPSCFANVVSHFKEIALKNREMTGKKRLFFERMQDHASGGVVTPAEMEYLTEVNC